VNQESLRRLGNEVPLVRPSPTTARACVLPPQDRLRSCCSGKTSSALRRWL